MFKKCEATENKVNFSNAKFLVLHCSFLIYIKHNFKYFLWFSAPLVGGGYPGGGGGGGGGGGYPRGGPPSTSYGVPAAPAPVPSSSYGAPSGGFGGGGGGGAPSSSYGAPSVGGGNGGYSGGGKICRPSGCF